MTETRCYRIKGIVQGVGFRPHVNKLALENELKGWVLNDSEGVLLEIQGTTNNLQNFIDQLSSQPPSLAQITKIILQTPEEEAGTYETFEIRKSVSQHTMDTIVPPDSYVCPDCLDEMRDPEDKRYRYPFINCTNCGPRYSIIQKMPYDRRMTTMSEFVMCDQCEIEYSNVENRRYHAQPNACPACGPELEYVDQSGNPLDLEDPVKMVIHHLLLGKIIAIKSLGGFHLAVNAQHDTAVQKLRQLKKRDAKPFALMVKDVDTAKQFCDVSTLESEQMVGPQRPIVLLKKRPGILPESIAPGNPNFGIMLPSAPLHYLLLEDSRLSVLVMTSGNISGHPIAFKNKTALKQLRRVADYFLLNNRDIHTRLDDSVLSFSITRCDQALKTFFRRSRGYAPFPVQIAKKVRPILALGPELKNTLALSKSKNVYISQHIGDLKNDETLESHQLTASLMGKLFKVDHEAVAIDLHPHFRTDKAIKADTDLPLIKVQHHHAHMTSCMAENNLENEVIGVIFDGMGYGIDGTIWGGEFLVGDYGSFERKGQLFPLDLIGGDKAVKEPIRVAVSLLVKTFGDQIQSLEIPLFDTLTKQKREVFTKMAENSINTFQTSSMGRLFDGVSSLIGLCHEIEYEAQAAIELEALLNNRPDMVESLDYDIIEHQNRFALDYRPMVRHLVNLIQNNTLNQQDLSRKFHSTIVEATIDLCCRLAAQTGISEIVFSGGVFMNRYLLCNLVTESKVKGLTPYVHENTPTNDGGVALGQIMVADAKLNQEEK